MALLFFIFILVLGLSVSALQGISWKLGETNNLGRQSKIQPNIDLQKLHKERIVDGQIIASRFDSLSDGSIWEVYGDGYVELRYKDGQLLFATITSGNIDYLEGKCRDLGGGVIYMNHPKYSAKCLATTTADKSKCEGEGYKNPQSCSGVSSGGAGGSTGDSTGGTSGGTTGGGISGGSCTFPYSSLSQCSSCGYLQTRCVSGKQQELSYSNGVCAYTTIGTCGTPEPSGGTSQSTCSDIDGGKTYNIKGILTDKNNISHEDVCIYSDVKEYYCSGSEYSDTKVNCQYGCSNGACLSSVPSTSPVKFLVWNEDGQTFPNTPLIINPSTTYSLSIKVYSISQQDGNILCVNYNPSHVRGIQPEKYTSFSPTTPKLNIKPGYTPMCFSIPVTKDSGNSYSYSSDLRITTSPSYQSSDITLELFNPSISTSGLGQYIVSFKKSTQSQSNITSVKSEAEFTLWDLDGKVITPTNPQMMESLTRYDLPIKLLKIPQYNNIICVSYDGDYFENVRLKDYASISVVPSGLPILSGFTPVCYSMSGMSYTSNFYSYTSDLIVATGGSYRSTNIFLTYFNPSISSSALSQYTLPTAAFSGAHDDTGDNLKFDGASCNSNDQCQSGFCKQKSNTLFFWYISKVCSQREVFQGIGINTSQQDIEEFNISQSKNISQPSIYQQTPPDKVSRPQPTNIITQFFDFITSLFRR